MRGPASRRDAEPQRACNVITILRRAGLARHINEGQVRAGRSAVGNRPTQPLAHDLKHIRIHERRLIVVLETQRIADSAVEGVV